MHTCNPITWEVESRGLEVQGQPELHKTLPRKQTNTGTSLVPEMLELSSLMAKSVH